MQTNTQRRSVRVLGALSVAAGTLPFALMNPAAAAACTVPRRRDPLRSRHHRTARRRRDRVRHSSTRFARLGARSVGVYAVDYPATDDFVNSTTAGVGDASAHLQATAANCPATRMVLGGYSQGAAVMDLATGAVPAQVADHVRGRRLRRPSKQLRGHAVARSAACDQPALCGKTIDLCVPNDPICAEGGWDMGAHVSYIQTGMVNQAAAFAADRL